MKTVFIAGFIISNLANCLCCLSYLNGLTRPQYFDLSYSFDSETIYFPGQRQFELYKDYVNVTGPGHYKYSAYSFCMGEHGGTHLDAPFHFDVSGWTVDDIPQRNLIDVPAVVIDVENDVNALKKPHEFTLEVSHIVAHEKSHGSIPSEVVVLVHTGWSRFWPDKVKYLGWDNSTGGEPSLNFPGISRDAANFLAEERKILGIGLDTASVDSGSNKAFPAHVALAGKQIYNLENVANLRSILHLNKGCKLHLFVVPLKIVGGTGSPTRILAYCKNLVK